MTSRSIVVVFLLGTALLAPAPAWCDPSDDKGRTEAADPDFIAGKQAIERKDWAAAISSFGKAAARNPGDADAQNYLGYASRNLGKMDDAFRHYERALKLDPGHLGAHEYVGEAYLLAGKPDKAREHLAALQKLCKSCEEFQDLQKAIGAYERKAR